MDAYIYRRLPSDARNHMLEVCAVKKGGAFSTATHERRSSIGTPTSDKTPLNVTLTKQGIVIGRTESPYNDAPEEIGEYATARGCPKLALAAGKHHSRIWKGGRRVRIKQFDYFPCPLVEDLPTFESFLESLHRLEILCSDLEDIFRTLHPVNANAAAFGGRIRELLLLAATEVEGQWRSVLEANHIGLEQNYFTTRDYVKLLVPMDATLDRPAAHGA